MREIKFRAWDIIRNRLRYDILSMDIGFIEEYSCLYMSETSPLYKKDCIIEQYTGLKDKNGTEVFEGDVVELDDIWEDTVGTIIFKTGMFGVEQKNEYKTFHDMHYFYDSTGCEIEVIGNIHEAPELLEKA